MVSGTATGVSVSTERVLRDCVATLQRVGDYRLPAALDRRLLWLSENKETLTETEQEELFALIEFAEERTVEKVQARAVLKALAEVWPQLISQQP
jgi:hypothetical protein